MELSLCRLTPALRILGWLLDFWNICAPLNKRPQSTDKDTLMNVLCIFITRRFGHEMSSRIGKFTRPSTMD